MAGYEIDFLPQKSPLFQFEMAFSDIWIFLTPNGGCRKTDPSCFCHRMKIVVAVETDIKMSVSRLKLDPEITKNYSC